ncbi:MAG TPA: hypothetical protein VE396_17855 [Xanthobacteraceae bacterium]|nr:hypothetical protein [Xanthobacteraceae bacterium]
MDNTAHCWRFLAAVIASCTMIAAVGRLARQQPRNLRIHEPLVIYKVDGDGLTGAWAIRGHDGVGTEHLRPLN